MIILIKLIEELQLDQREKIDPRCPRLNSISNEM